MDMGGICIGCTMPGFPDRFSPIFASPRFEGAGSPRAKGGFLRRVRSARSRPAPARDRRPTQLSGSLRFDRSSAGSA